VAEELGFHRAAARLHVSQPTLSAQVRQLEDVLGVVLFERDKRRVLVTPPGEEIVSRARKALLAVEELIVTAERSKDRFAATLRIGVIPTVAPYLLPEITPAILEQHPKLELVFREEKTEQVVLGLREGKLDAGIVARVPELGDLEMAEIAHDPFVIALPKKHPLAKKKGLGLDDLATEPVLLLEEGHCLRGQALELCSRVGARETDLRRGQIAIRELAGDAPSRAIVLVWRRGSPLDEVFRAVASTSKRAAAKRLRS